MIRISPVFVVDRIEPCLDFWTKRFGFQQTVAVPEGDHLGFVTLVREGAEVMYQSRTSLRHDIPALPDDTGHSSNITHIELTDFAILLENLEGVDVVVPPRRTFHGGVQVYVREPGGNIVAFSAVSARDGRSLTEMGL